MSKTMHTREAHSEDKWDVLMLVVVAHERDLDGRDVVVDDDTNARACYGK